jgi:hypothetical protein
VWSRMVGGVSRSVGRRMKALARARAERRRRVKRASAETWGKGKLEARHREAWRLGSDGLRDDSVAGSAADSSLENRENLWQAIWAAGMKRWAVLHYGKSARPKARESTVIGYGGKITSVFGVMKRKVLGTKEPPTAGGSSKIAFVRARNITRASKLSEAESVTGRTRPPRDLLEPTKRRHDWSSTIEIVSSSAANRGGFHNRFQRSNISSPQNSPINSARGLPVGDGSNNQVNLMTAFSPAAAQAPYVTLEQLGSSSRLAADAIAGSFSLPTRLLLSVSSLTSKDDNSSQGDVVSDPPSPRVANLAAQAPPSRAPTSNPRYLYLRRFPSSPGPNITLVPRREGQNGSGSAHRLRDGQSFPEWYTSPHRRHQNGASSVSHVSNHEEGTMEIDTVYSPSTSSAVNGHNEMLTAETPLLLRPQHVRRKRYQLSNQRHPDTPTHTPPPATISARRVDDLSELSIQIPDRAVVLGEDRGAGIGSPNRNQIQTLSVSPPRSRSPYDICDYIIGSLDEHRDVSVSPIQRMTATTPRENSNSNSSSSHCSPLSPAHPAPLIHDVVASAGIEEHKELAEHDNESVNSEKDSGERQLHSTDMIFVRQQANAIAKNTLLQLKSAAAAAVAAGNERNDLL